MTTEEPLGVLREEILERDSESIQCDCGGLCENVETTTREVKEFQHCGRSWACCVASFVCKACRKRFVCHLKAPESDWDYYTPIDSEDE